MRHQFAPITTTTCLVVLAAGGAARPSLGQSIPVRPGVTLVFATKPVDSSLRPDFERLLTVEGVTPDELVLQDYVAYALKPSGEVITNSFRRTTSRREMQFSRSLFTGGMANDTSQHRGTSFMMTSAAVLRSLRATGAAGMRVELWGGREESGTLERVEPGPVQVPVLINGRPDSIPTIHVRLEAVDVMDRRDPTYEFWFADDTAHAWLVRNHTMQDGQEGEQELVRIEWADSTTMENLASGLRRACRARLSGVYFASGSAEIAPASDPALGTVAALLMRSPDWRVTIEGYTDSIGGPSYNLVLSERRASAVRATLVTRYHVEGGHLATVGYGLARPVASNSTLTGRARNRRVELVRACPSGAPS